MRIEWKMAPKHSWPNTVWIVRHAYDWLMWTWLSFMTENVKVDPYFPCRTSRPSHAPQKIREQEGCRQWEITSGRTVAWSSCDRSMFWWPPQEWGGGCASRDYQMDWRLRPKTFHLKGTSWSNGLFQNFAAIYSKSEEGPQPSLRWMLLSLHIYVRSFFMLETSLPVAI